MTTLLWTLLACSTPTAPEPASAPASAPAVEPPDGSTYDGRFASDPELTPEEVARIPADQLRLVRNEVFARHGRAFQSEDLKQHFASQPWYRVDAGFTDARLTANDRHNVELIRSFEGDRSRDALGRGEYTGENRTLALVDPGTAELLDAEEDMYNWERTSRRWASRGRWVLTWDGPERWDPGKAREAMLWELDHDGGRILSVRELGKPSG